MDGTVDRDEAEKIMYDMRYYSGKTDEDIDEEQIEKALEQMYDSPDPLDFGDWYSEAISAAFGEEDGDGEVYADGMQDLFYMMYDIEMGHKPAEAIVQSFNEDQSGGLDKQEQEDFWNKMFGIEEDDAPHDEPKDKDDDTKDDDE